MRVPNWVASTRFGKRFIDNLLALLFLPALFSVLGLLLYIILYIIYSITLLPTFVSTILLSILGICVASICNESKGMFVDYGDDND